MNTIDLRSDTLTLPTDEMRRAMYAASLGDDVYREDPTVNELEELAASDMGKEAALFVVSGTMSNLLAILTHTRPGDEIILGDESHMFWYEVGGASAVGGVVMHTLPNDRNGKLMFEDIRANIRADNIHYPKTKLICIENTHNRCGGVVLEPEYIHQVANIAHDHQLMIHLDGARIFNASVFLKIPCKELSKHVDSVCFCLSKGLGAPVGSILCGSKDFIEEARKYRKMLGGGMRQAGVIAAAGIVALKYGIDRLEEDHKNALKLGNGLANIYGIEIDVDRIQTNIVMFEPPKKFSAAGFVEILNNEGIRILAHSDRRLRAVTHIGINPEDIDEVLVHVQRVVKMAN